MLTVSDNCNIVYLDDKYAILHSGGETVEIIISSNTNKPIYEQITEQIKAMVMCGELITETRSHPCGHWQNPCMSV